MRVFILCTGRTGSAAIINACKHIENFSSAHESRTSKWGQDRFNYPDNHIEADNRLAWHLGQLHQLYGNDPFYVHLTRDRDKVAQSFMRRFYIPESIIDAYCEGIKMTPPEKLRKEARLQACYDYIDTVNSNIKHFMSDKQNVMKIRLENIEDDFTAFWRKIGANGNLEHALMEFKEKHNSSSKRKLGLRFRLKLLLIREWRNLMMSLSP